ncbi:ribosomal-protein-alanine N-acetyltransferase [Paenibacillus mucilaginosus]|uniref:GNAT family N-acetyltransferase n=1 Tax=Paenibacillus mucilaginosus TaxID=61624 RepID=UPI003D20CCC9
MLMQGQAVYTRILLHSDAEALWRLKTENRGFFQPFEPVQDEASYTRAAVKEYISHSLAEQEQGGSFSFGIFTPDDELIGRVRLSCIVRGAWQNANLGYMLAERWNGRGLMTEAVGLTLKFAFEHANLHRVQAGIMPHNLGSQRVAEKNGMRCEGLAERYLRIAGVWEDHRIYAITAEEWRERRSAAG